MTAAGRSYRLEKKLKWERTCMKSKLVVRPEDLSAANKKVTGVWNVAPCSLVEVNRHFIPCLWRQ
jgi:hypothetical protein